MPHDDFSKPLADEVLTDMANNFFGDRVGLEENIRYLYSMADLVRKKEAMIYERAAFLNYLMLTPQAARSIYRASGVDEEIFGVRGDITENVLPTPVPTALTRKGEYIKFVLWGYEALQHECWNYIHGTREGLPEKERPTVDDADYLLLKSMNQLINEEIDRINNRCLPSQVLQTAKTFDPTTRAKEYVTGGGAYYGDECTLNENLAFKHIEFSSLNVREFPEMPSLEKVRDGIIKEVKANYAQNKTRVHDMLGYVRRLSRLAAEKSRQA